MIRVREPMAHGGALWSSGVAASLQFLSHIELPVQAAPLHEEVHAIPEMRVDVMIVLGNSHYESCLVAGDAGNMTQTQQSDDIISATQQSDDISATQSDDISAVP